MKTNQERKAPKWSIALETESEGVQRYDEDEFEEWTVRSDEDEISPEESYFIKKYLDEWEER